MDATAGPAGRLDAAYALTVWQPWASLIVLSLKPYEFRGWAAPKSFVGRRNAIHAARPAWHAEEVKVITRDPERTCFGGLRHSGAQICDVDLARRSCCAARRIPGHGRA